MVCRVVDLSISIPYLKGVKQGNTYILILYASIKVYTVTCSFIYQKYHCERLNKHGEDHYHFEYKLS